MSKFFALASVSALGAIALSSLHLSSSPAIAAPQLTTAATRPQQVKVFFPKKLAQPTRLDYVESVWRQPQTPSVAQFAIAQVIAGPTAQERQRGFTAPVTLRGASNCGKDFTLSITANVAKLKFCRQIVSGGVGDDARMTSALNATLKQFSTVRSVVLLDQKGNCLGDMSGENRCLRR